MAQIEETVTFEGILRREEMPDTETAMLQDYRIVAITKGATYVLIDALPYDFIIQNMFYRVTEAFDGTIDLGTDANHSRIHADANFIKTVGKRSVAKSIMLDAGTPIKLFLGAGTTGKIEIHVTGFLLMPSLLSMA